MEVLIPGLVNIKYIQRLEKEYELRFCRIDEIGRVIEFINSHWKKNHILVQSKDMMDWQHLDKEHNRYNFVLAIHKITNDVHAILGFIPTGLFSGSVNAGQTWAAIWKVREDLATTGLGLALYNYLQNNTETETLTISGVNPRTIKMYERLNFQTGILKQWYILNNKINKFALVAKVSEANRGRDFSSAHEKSFFACTKKDFIDLINRAVLEFPVYKLPQYYIKRFFEHPIYQYNVYTIGVNNVVNAVIFTRVCEANGAKAMRIVDYIGNYSALKDCYACFQQLLQENNAEYIDFINIGFDEDCLLDAGFLDRRASDIIIPDYYEPFCQENVDIYYASKTINNNNKCIIYKGDADQDRPSIIKGGRMQ